MSYLLGARLQAQVYSPDGEGALPYHPAAIASTLSAATGFSRHLDTRGDDYG